MRPSCIVFVLILAMLSLSDTALAGPLISIRSDGNGQYEINGDGFDKVGGVDLTVTYDPSTYANPKFSGGTLFRNGMTVSNTNTAGIVRVAVLRAGREGISGTGGIATLRFDLTGSSEGSVALNASMVDLIGNPFSVKIVSIAGTKPGSPGTDINGAAEIPHRLLGSVAMVADAPKPAEKEKGKPNEETVLPPPVDPGKQTPVRTAGEQEDDLVAQTAKTQEKPAPKLISHPGIQERFIAFKGEKSPKALVALFDNYTIAGFKQDPGIGIADGKTAVNISIEVGLTGKDDPKFLLSGAKIHAASKGEKGDFSLEIVPEAKTCEVILKVIGSSSIQEIPLTVAPLVDLAIVGKETLSEDDFNRGMKRMIGRAGGVETFSGCQADYVFTANYLHYQSGIKAGKQ